MKEHNMNMKPRENPGNLRIWHLGVLGGGICIVNFKKRVARKLHRIILLHFGLVTFRFHSGRTLKPLMFMISDLVDVSMTHNTNVIHLRRHQDTSNNLRKSQNVFRNMKCGHIIFGKSTNLKILEKTSTEAFRRSV